MYTDTANIPSIVNSLRETFQTGKPISSTVNAANVLTHTISQRSYQGQRVQKTTIEKLSEAIQ